MAVPHDLKLTRQPCGEAPIEATIQQIGAAGPWVRLELSNHADGTPFEVQISREQQQEFRPQAGERVYVEIKHLRVFAQDYSI